MTWLNIISSSSLGLFILMKQTEGRALRNGNDEEQSLPLLTESTGLEHLEPGSIIHIEPTNTDKHTQVDAGVIGRDVHPDSETIIDVINYEQDFTDIIDTIIKNAEGIDIDEDEEFDAIVGLYGSKWHLFSRWMKCEYTTCSIYFHGMSRQLAIYSHTTLSTYTHQAKFFIKC